MICWRRHCNVWFFRASGDILFRFSWRRYCIDPYFLLVFSIEDIAMYNVFFYLAPLHIRVLLIHVSGKTKVRDLHLPPLSDEHISGCQVSVNKLLNKSTHIVKSGYNLTNTRVYKCICTLSTNKWVNGHFYCDTFIDTLF